MPWFIQVIIDLLTEVKNWILALIGIVTVVVVAIDVMKYQAGDAQEKADAVKSIRNKLLWCGGIFIAVWIVLYVVGKFSTAYKANEIKAFFDYVQVLLG